MNDLLTNVIPNYQEAISESVTASAEGKSSSVYELGAPSGGTGQVIVGTNATLIKVRNDCRRGIKITNLGTVDVFIGFGPSVNVLSGDLLPGTKGAFIVIPATLDIYAIVATGTATVSYLELSER
jgi:hypothetical protein